jgi:hypothetical protein
MHCLSYIHTEARSREGSVGIATGCTARVRFPAVQDLSLLHSVQTESGANPASYPVGSGGSFPGGKTVGGVKLTTYIPLVPRTTIFCDVISCISVVHQRFGGTYCLTWRTFQSWRWRRYVPSEPGTRRYVPEDGTLKIGKSLPTIRGNILLPSSGSKNKRRK